MPCKNLGFVRACETAIQRAEIIPRIVSLANPRTNVYGSGRAPVSESIPFEPIVTRKGLVMRAPRRSRRGRAFTLVELLVVIAIVGLLIGLLLPAVQQAREAARRIQCTNNLKQLALAAANYHDVNSVLPGASYAASNLGHFVRLLPYLEQGPSYDSANFSRQALFPENVTVAGYAISGLLCPSDTDSRPVPVDASEWPFGVPPGSWRQCFSSYAGCAGTWTLNLNKGNDRFAQRYANMNGVIFGESIVALAGITDGTSNTLLLSETAHGVLTGYTGISGGLKWPPSEYQWWQVGSGELTQFETFFPPNGFKRLGQVLADHAPRNPASFHPGGINVSLCDGSVRFIKETIDSWRNDPATGYPPGIGYDAGGVPDRGDKSLYTIAPGTYFGVWQRLSTRNFGDVVGANEF